MKQDFMRIIPTKFYEGIHRCVQDTTGGLRVSFFRSSLRSIRILLQQKNGARLCLVFAYLVYQIPAGFLPDSGSTRCIVCSYQQVSSPRSGICRNEPPETEKLSCRNFHMVTSLYQILVTTKTELPQKLIFLTLIKQINYT